MGLRNSAAAALFVLLAAGAVTDVPASGHSRKIQDLTPAGQADKLLQEAAKLPAAERAKAIAMVEEAVALREKAVGGEHRSVAEALFMLGNLYRASGDQARALPHLRRAASILEKLEPASADLAGVLNTLGQTLQALGDYDQARGPFEKALAIREKALGPGDPAVATSLNNLALLLHVKGDYAAADPLYRRALAIRDEKLGASNPLVAQSINNLAQLHKDRGEYLEARPLFERALALYEQARGAEHADVATALNNLGLLLYDVGDYDAAEPMLTRAIAIREKALGAEHPLVAQALNNLALVYQSGRFAYAKAEPLYLRSLAIREKTVGPDHPDVARALNNLAVSYQEQGLLAKAEPLYRRALEILEKRVGETSVLTIQAVNNLAVLYLLQNDLAKAEPLYLRAVQAARTLGTQHPLLASSLASLAVYYERSGNLVKAIETQAAATEVSERNLALLVAAGSEQQKRRYLATLGDETDITLSLHNRRAKEDPAAIRLAALTVLRRKGRILDAMSRSVESLRASLDEADRALLDRLAATRGRLAALVLQGAPADKRAEHATEVARLEKEQGELESAISGRSAAFRAVLRPVTLDLVERELPADAALVEIALYRPFDSKATKVPERFSQPRYTAYVLRPGVPVRSVELGEAAAIDNRTRELRTALRDPKNQDVKRASRALDEKLFAPIRPLLGDARRLLVSPDGLLNLVPFAALSGEDGRYRIEQYAFTYLTSGRDLLRLEQRGRGRSAPVVVANPDFGAAAAEPSTASAQRSVDLTRATFVPLPGTAEEAKALQTLLPGAAVLTGAAATERAVKTRSGPSILHVATHGFFLGAETAPSSGSQGTRLLVMDPAKSAMSADANPLLRSGLAFAGANTRNGGDGEDGILLALEASGLDLHGTGLVVLSACETGVGEVRAGEGVYGLRRALVLAGAESQVMSLWQVSDAATRDLMVAYYKGLRGGGGRGDALRDVQLQMLRGTSRSHPFYWASFIQSGDWRPLSR